VLIISLSSCPTTTPSERAASSSSIEILHDGKSGLEEDVVDKDFTIFCSSAIRREDKAF
jgi:hypothetical protein